MIEVYVDVTLILLAVYFAISFLQFIIVILFKNSEVNTGTGLLAVFLNSVLQTLLFLLLQSSIDGGLSIQSIVNLFLAFCAIVVIGLLTYPFIYRLLEKKSPRSCSTITRESLLKYAGSK